MKTLKKLFFMPLFVTTVVLFMVSCEKTEKCTFCNVENPLTDLEWLKTTVVEMTESAEHCSVSKCNYQTDKQGFIISFCDNCPDNMVSLTDCAGNTLCNIGGYAGFRDTIYNIENIEVLFKNY